MEGLSVDSPFIEALSLSLTHFLWQGCVVASVASIGFAQLSRSPGSRYVLGLLCLAVMAACPLLTFGWLYQQGDRNSSPLPGQTVAVSSSAVLSAVTAGSVGSTPGDAVVGVRDPWRIAHLAIVSLWCGGQCLIGGRLLLSALFVQRLKRLAAPVDRDLKRVARRLAHRIGVLCPEICVAETLDGAIAAGFFRQIIVIPTAWLNNMTPEMLNDRAE